MSKFLDFLKQDIINYCNYLGYEVYKWDFEHIELRKEIYENKVYLYTDVIFFKIKDKSFYKYRIPFKFSLFEYKEFLLLNKIYNYVFNFLLLNS